MNEYALTYFKFQWDKVYRLAPPKLDLTICSFSESLCYADNVPEIWEQFRTLIRQQSWLCVVCVAWSWVDTGRCADQYPLIGSTSITTHTRIKHIEEEWMNTLKMNELIVKQFFLTSPCVWGFKFGPELSHLATRYLNTAVCCRYFLVPFFFF